MSDEPRPLGPAIDRLLAHLGAPPARVITALESAWPEIAGPGLAACSHPIELRDDILLVSCREPAWAAQLRWMETDLCRRLSARLDGVTITAIRVRHDEGNDGPSLTRW